MLEVGNFGLCSIRLRRHGPFISCHIFLPLCFALSGTHLGSSVFFFQVCFSTNVNLHVKSPRQRRHVMPFFRERLKPRAAKVTANFTEKMWPLGEVRKWSYVKPHVQNWMASASLAPADLKDHEIGVKHLQLQAY